MNSEIPHKYKYMLNKIINCIIEYIIKNLNDHNLIEAKLLLINNYILDVFHNQELSRNEVMKKKYKKISTSRNFHDKTVSPEYDKKISLSKFKNIVLTINKTDKNPKEQNDERKISSHNDKIKINQLKKLLKNEQDKNMIMELAYLKKLSFIQEKLHFYESKKNNSKNNINNNNLQQSSEDNKTFLSIFPDKEKEKENIKSKLTKNISNKIMAKSTKNKKIKNDFFSFDSKNKRHSMNLSQFNDSILNKSKFSFNIEKINEFIKNKNNFFKGTLNGCK